MNMSCSTRTIKYLMFAFNLFFVISGIIIIAVGATVKTVYSNYSDFLDSKYFTLPNMLIATGAFIFCISFFGCCGAIKESWIMLGVFSIFLCIIFVFEFSAGIAGYVLRDKTMNYLDDTLRKNMDNYQNTSHVIWDSIQSGFQCCGVENYTDWSGKFPPDPYALPVSCCPASSGTAGAFYCNSYTTTVSTEGTKTTNIITTNAPTTTEEPTTEPPTTEPPTTDGDLTTTAKVTEPTKSTEPTKPTEPTEAPKSINATESTNATAVTNATAPDPEVNLKSLVRSQRAAIDLRVDNVTLPSTPSAESTSRPYHLGCKVAFGDYIKKHAVQIGGCALGLAIVQILGIAFSCHLVRQLKNGYYST